VRAVESAQTGYTLARLPSNLQWTTRRPDAKCWWCQYSIQTQEHLSKNFPQWRSQQKTLWAGLRRGQKAPGPDLGTRSHQNRGAARRRAVQPSGPIFSRNYRCRKDVRPPAAEGEDGAASEASDWENWEREEQLALLSK